MTDKELLNVAANLTAERYRENYFKNIWPIETGT